MLINFSVSVIVLIVGIITGIFVTIILLSEKQNAQANRFLSALVVVSVGTLFHNFLIESGIYNQYNSLYFLPIIFSLGVGPLLYLYVNRLIGIKKLSNASLFFHLLPVIIQVLLYTWCFLQSNETKYDIYTSVYEPYWKPLQNFLVYISVAIYLLLCFKEIKYYKAKLDDFYSNNYKLTLRWLKSLLYIFMGYYVLLIFFQLAASSFSFSADYFPSDLIRCLILFVIAFFAIRQNGLIEIQKNIESVEIKRIIEESSSDQVEVEETQKIPSSDIKTDNKVEEFKSKQINETLLAKIINIVEVDQLFLNENLTVNDIAVKLGYSSRSISQTINAGLQKSFSRFINEYRVNLFREKRNSDANANLSIMGLAYDCGFNSKTTFNRTYKEITGSLPKEQISSEK